MPGFWKWKRGPSSPPFHPFSCLEYGKEASAPGRSSVCSLAGAPENRCRRSGNRGRPAAERRGRDDVITKAERKQSTGFRQGLRNEGRGPLYVQASGQCRSRASHAFFQRRPSWNSFVCFSQGPSQRPGKMKNLVHWRRKSDRRAHECGGWQAIKTRGWGTSLVVQWLRLHPPDAEDLGSIPGQRTRSHMPQLRPMTAKKKKKKKQTDMGPDTLFSCPVSQRTFPLSALVLCHTGDDSWGQMDLFSFG